MHGSDYWAKRFEALENASNKTAKEAYASLEPVFSKAGRELDKEIITWLKRIAKNNNIKLADARKMLTKKERQEFSWGVQEYIKKGRENGLNGEYLRELENASAKYHINRLDTLNLRLKNIIETAFNDEHATINSMLKKVYTDNYYKSFFEVQKGFNIGFDIAQVNPDVLNKLLTKPWTSDSLNFSDRIWIARDRMVQDLQQELVRTCVLGKSPDESIKRMSNFVNKKVKNAKVYASRLIMTEQAAFHARSQEDAFKELDIEEFEVVATLDSHTSEICREMDGKHFPMSEYKIGITAPPFHVYCRSVTAPYFNDEWSIGKRAARDESGKTYYIPSDMTYPEWKKRFVDGEIKKDLKPVNPANTVDRVAKNFNSVKLEKPLNKGIVSDLKEIEIDGNKHIVDGKHVVLDYSAKEKEVAELIASNLGKDVLMIPRVAFPQGVKTPDYLIDGVRYDLKEIISNGKNTLYNQINKKKGQSNNFIFDITKSDLSIDEIIRQIEGIYSSDNTKFVDEIWIIKDNEILEMYKRKK